MEERVLRTGFAGEFLYVVDDEHIDCLVETDKVVDVVFAHGGCVLRLKSACAQIEHAALRILLLHAIANGLYKVCFAHAGRSEDKHRVECLFFRIVGNCAGNGVCKFVAAAFAIVVESIGRLELRVERSIFLVVEWIWNLLANRCGAAA